MSCCTTRTQITITEADTLKLIKPFKSITSDKALNKASINVKQFLVDLNYAIKLHEI